MVGFATVGVVAWEIDRLNDVLPRNHPACPPTFIVYFPMGVELFVWRVITAVQVDRQLEGENEEVTFPGKPETSNETSLETSPRSR
jgi:hypothetical protein